MDRALAASARRESWLSSLFVDRGGVNSCEMLSREEDIHEVKVMLVERRGMRRFDRKAEKPHMPRRIASDVTLERDVPVPMSDGVQLMANVFHSFPPRRSPILMSVTPYAKDTLPDRGAVVPTRRGGPAPRPLQRSAAGEVAARELPSLVY